MYIIGLSNVIRKIIILSFVFLVFISVNAFALPQKSCVDLDEDGFGIIASKVCKFSGIDCNDDNKYVNPGAVEICNDSLDNNCNGVTNEGCCAPTFGQSCDVGVGECKSTGEISCDGSCSATPGIPSIEVCNDNLDNDCDGVINNGCPLPGLPLTINRVFKGSYDRTTQTNFVATKNKLIILVESGPSRTIDLKAANPDIKILRYTKFAGTHSPVTRPPNGDYFYAFASGTPNLIWFGPSGNPMKQTQFGWYFIDIMHNDMAAWALKERDFQTSDNGKYDGEFLDSAGPQTVDLVSEYPTNYSSVSKSDPSFNNDYMNAAVALMAKIREANTSSILIPNGYAGWMPQNFRGLGFLPFSNGIMFEGYAFKVSGKLFDLSRYTQEVNDFCTATKDGQSSIAVDYLQSDTDSKRMLAFSTYLLSMGRNSFIYTLSPKGDVAYFPEDKIELGNTLPSCATQVNGVFSRTFDNGVTVYTNMSGSDKIINFGRPNKKLIINGDTTWNGNGSISWIDNPSSFVLKTGEGIIVK